MAVLDQDGVYTYVSPGWERHRPHRTGGHRPEGLGKPVPHLPPRSSTGKPVFAKAVNANGPAFLPPSFPCFDRMGSCAGCFSMSSSRVWRTPEPDQRIRRAVQQGGVLARMSRGRGRYGLTTSSAKRLGPPPEGS